MKKGFFLIVITILSALSLMGILCGCEAPVCEHSWSDAILTSEPTCKQNGINTFVCLDCGATRSEIMPMLTTHTPEIAVRENEVSATCKVNGSYDEVVYCAVCDKELSRESKVTEKLTEHASITPMNTCSVCDKDMSTPGIKYSLFADKNSYVVAGIGTASGHIIIASSYNGLPVISIGDGAFYDCRSLTSIEIPASVTSIGDSAFEDCRSLTSIEIPDSVTSIGDDAFDDCDSLKYNGYDNAYYLGNSANPYLVLVKANSNGITSCNIHSSTRIVCYQAFSCCSSLSSVVIPNSVTSIGNYAFYYCSSLTSVVIGNSVTSIGDEAFRGCSSLTNVTFGENSQLTSIGNYAFYYRSSLTSVVIGNSVTSIGDRAFFGCSSLTSIEIPNSVTSIGNCAFFSCSDITSVVIGNSVTSIGDGAFGDCTKLTSVTFKNPNGWYVTGTEGATSGIDVTLTDSTQNVTYLESTYCNYYWYRKTN